jgi:hypothetical protein
MHFSDSERPSIRLIVANSTKPASGATKSQATEIAAAAELVGDVKRSSSEPEASSHWMSVFIFVNCTREERIHFVLDQDSRSFIHRRTA